MINIQIKRPFHLDGLKESIVNAVEGTLKNQSAGEQEIDLSIVITSDKELQRLNKNHLGINNPTDVLSFSGGDIDPDTGNRYLGDVIISFERVRVQALEHGWTELEEIQLLVIHGTLHLLGFDHSESNQEIQMWSIQTNILHSLK